MSLGVTDVDVSPPVGWRNRLTAGGGLGSLCLFVCLFVCSVAILAQADNILTLLVPQHQ